MMAVKLRQVGGIDYDEREEAFAQELYPTLEAEVRVGLPDGNTALRSQTWLRIH